MSTISKHLARFGLVILAGAAVVGCSSDGDGGTDPGSITLTLSVPSATIPQGGSQAITGTLTRAGGFTGTVNLTVTGAPTGVTAVVSNVQTTGAVTTATITINVPAATPAGLYPLVVHGTGTGVTEATANFALTVTAVTPAYLLTLSSPTVSIVQGAATPTITVNLARTNFPGNVTLSVDNLPTGVTASFNPANPQTGISSVLTLTVPGATPIGTTNLTVRGVAAGMTDQTAPLALTVTAPTPSFTLSLSSASLSIAQGASTPTTTVNIARVNFPGDIALSVLNLPTGVTASFAPANPQTGNSSVLTLTVAAGAPTGTFNNLSVQGVGTAGTVSTPLSLTITAGTPAPSFTLSLTQATLSIAQGASTPTTTVNIARVNFPGDVALSVLNLPTGVTASFAPANPQTGNSSVLTLTVAAGAPMGTFNTLAVQGVGTPGTVSTPLTLTITAGTPAGGYTLGTTPPTSVSVTRGVNSNVTVNINRFGGNTSDIALTATGTLPTGMSLSFLPTSTTGNSSVLTITTTAATPTGPVPIVIRGNTTGLAEQTANLTITVNAPGGSGNVTVTFATCAAADKAVWLAFMDGTAGTWTAVTGVADVYQFNITQSKGSFAYVTLGTGTSEIIVQHMTQAELTAGTFDFCGTVTPPTTETINGTVANIPLGFFPTIAFGGGAALPFANGPFQVTGALDGSHFLIGYAKALAAGGGDRVYIDPVAQNPAHNGTFANTVDFLHATNSFSPAAATFNLTNTTGGETMGQGMTFFSGTGANACMPASLYFGSSITGTSFVGYGIPVAKQPAGGLHQITVTAGSTTASRTLIESFVDIIVRAGTALALPAPLPALVATDAGGPYKRPSIAVTGLPAEYTGGHSMSYVDQTVTGKSGVVSASPGWAGGPNFTLVLPNFSGVGTFQNSWAPASGDALNWSFGTSGGTFGGVCTAGQRFVTASRSGTL